MCTASRPNCTGWLTHLIDTMPEWMAELFLAWLPDLAWLLDEEEPDADAA